MKTVEIQESSNSSGFSPQFSEREFDKAIYEKGYRVIHEKCLKCPCKSPRTNQLSNCKNCGGTGWIFYNPIETRMLLYSMNQTTQFKEWSEENVGNVNISHLNKDRITFMDRITLIESEANFNEVRFIKKSEDNILFAYTSYHVKTMLHVALYVDEITKLRVLDPSEYEIDGNHFILNSSFLANFIDDQTYSITMTYIHQPQFHVVDFARQVANSRAIIEGKETLLDLPLSAIGRRAHFVLDTENINFNRLIDNSTIDSASCGIQIKIVDSYSKMC